jgi:hypothetical protein
MATMIMLISVEWLRLGFFMDFVPPVMPGPKSTYPRVRKADATSDCKVRELQRRERGLPV